MGDCEMDNCFSCGERKIVSRKYYKYPVKCDCCNGANDDHFEMVKYCSNCEPKPPRIIKPIIGQNVDINKDDCVTLGLEPVAWDSSSNSGYFVKGDFKIGVNSTSDGFSTISQNDHGNHIMRFSGLIKTMQELKMMLNQLEVI